MPDHRRGDRLKHYQEWLELRRHQSGHDGIKVQGEDLNARLFPHQRDIVVWALARGRSCIFADTGLGKTLMQMEWARVVSNRGRVMVLAPLAVAQQTVREAHAFGIHAAYARDDSDKHKIVVTNYEMIDRFDPADFAGVVLDESSILKSYTGKFRTTIIETFRDTPFRLACTATPAPNDHMELGNHAEFVGVKSRTEMLSEFFVHDGGSTQNWRLKGHAVSAFWAWVASWAAMIRRPSDYGYPDEGFALPPLSQRIIKIADDEDLARTAGVLFTDGMSLDIRAQRAVRRGTVSARVEAITEAIAAEPDEPALVWCEYNAESDALSAAIPDAVSVSGSDSATDKTERLMGFADGAIRVLVTKPKIAGFGMNWQHCARVYFTGPSHSFEQTYQAIRRCWRFGQSRPVVVATCATPAEGAVVKNLERKRLAAEDMASRMAAAGVVASRAIAATHTSDAYNATEGMEVPEWLS